jgi:hypothetical protein
MGDKTGPKVCTSCGKTKSIGQFTKGWNRCKRCNSAEMQKDSSDDSSDDTKQRCKRLEKRVKKLEKTVEKLYEMLENQHTKTFGIEKMIQGVALGVRMNVNSANIVELSEDS